MKKEIVNQHERAFTPLTDDIKKKLMGLYEKDIRDDMECQLLDRGDMKVSTLDFERLRFRLFCTFYGNQSWYIRLFKNQKTRISIAWDAANSMVNDYINGLVEEMLKFHLDLFCLELENSWDKHWLEYINILEKEK